MDTKVMIDTIWVLIAAFLVFFMNIGFATVESGFSRAKNTVNILSKNFIVFAVSSLASSSSDGDLCLATATVLLDWRVSS
jgi:ammonia channel protein AmtB